MCYAKTDSMLEELESRLRDIIMKEAREESFSSGGLAEYVTYDCFDELLSHIGHAHVHYVLTQNNGCCADSIVALQDEIERLGG